LLADYLPQADESKACQAAAAAARGAAQLAFCSPTERKCTARVNHAATHQWHHEGMNDKWSRDSFLLGSGSVDNHGGYLRGFFLTTYLLTTRQFSVGLSISIPKKNLVVK
jgi:hypothetical protein